MGLGAGQAEKHEAEANAALEACDTDFGLVRPRTSLDLTNRRTE